jgi:hypothetical protein
MAISTDVLMAIAGENLGVYRTSPTRLREDVSQEAQIASDADVLGRWLPQSLCSLAVCRGY